VASPAGGMSQDEGASLESSGVISKASPRSVADTLSRFVEMLEAKGVKVFAVIDHSGEAARVGLELRDTKLVVFGNPKAGTAVMAAVPLAALDLPMKVLVWEDGGQTRVSYTAPSTLAARYDLSDELAEALTVVGPLTDALVEP
jgi:uncharacterized protein (DUF302 family)